MDFLIAILATILTVWFAFAYYTSTYWERKGVKQLKSNFFFGNLFKIKSIHLDEILQEIYRTFKGKASIAGFHIYGKPMAAVLDLDLAKQVLIKDFDVFVDRNDHRYRDNDPLAKNLFRMHGDGWREMRSKLSPTFTSGKMKFMFPTVVKTARDFTEAFEAYLKNTKDGVVEVHDLMARFTTDVIGTCAFGIECNSLKNPDCEFRRLGKKFSNHDNASIHWDLLRETHQKFFKHFGVVRFGSYFQDFMMEITEKTVKTREKHGIKRNDFFDILIDLKNQKDENGNDSLTIPQMAAQVFVFFNAGFETTSTNMSGALYELAKQPEIQDKLWQEINTVLEKYNDGLTYEALTEIPLLDQVVSETLRKYPALSSLTRVANRDYKVPGTDVVIEKGTNVFIPTKAIHYDPEIYENPTEFRPERFDPSEVKKRHPQSLLSFGDGPRNCIGLRFGRMESRIGLIHLLKSFKFSISPKTPDTLEISKRSFILIPDNGVWLKVEKT